MSSLEVGSRLYQKRPLIVEAMQWTGDFEAIRDFLPPTAYFIDSNLIIPTLEGDMIASLGWWIIRGIRGEYYPCESTIFDETYQHIERLP
jgi:hypothetical protein